jgi:hypothetical protein
MLLASHPIENAFAELGHSGATASTNLSGVAFHPNRNLLKVSVKQKRFSHVMAEVAAKSGAEIVIYGSDHADLTVNFDYMPLEEGLRYLLKGKDYLIFRPNDSSGALKVWILSTVRARETSGPEDRGEKWVPAQLRQFLTEQARNAPTKTKEQGKIYEDKRFDDVSQTEDPVEKPRQSDGKTGADILRVLQEASQQDGELPEALLKALRQVNPDHQ